MSIAVMQIPRIVPRRPMHGGWDQLFLYATTKHKPGIHVAAPELDAELHVETTTIMFADVVESVRLIEQDEVANVTRIRALLGRLVSEVIPKFQGAVLEHRGDGLLIKFPDARCAANCAGEVHRVASDFSGELAACDIVAFRIGIHKSPLFSDASSVFGLGLSHAARVAAMALPHQTLASVEVRDELADGADVRLCDLGNYYGKHLSVPLRLFEVLPLELSPSVDRMPKHDDHTQITLAVLPLDELTLRETDSSSSKSAVGDVFADLATQAFSRSAEIRVISRLSARAAARGLRNAASMVGKLGADYVVSGTWRAVSENVFLFGLELMACADDSIIWGDERRVSALELLQPQSEYLSAIVSGVIDALAAAEIKKTKTSPLPTIASHSLVLSSIGLMHRLSRDDFESARSVIEAVVERAPRHAVPRAWLARWHTFRVIQGWAASDRSDHEQALRHSELAVSFDPELSLVHAVRGSVNMSVQRDLASAFRCYSTAISLNPNDALAWTLKAAAHALDDDGAPALDAAMRALELSPLDPMRFLHESLAASACLTLGDYEAARKWAEKSIRANRAHHSTIRVAAIACALLGDEQAARSFIAELLRALPFYTVSTFLSANPHAEVSDNRRRFADALRSACLPEA